MIRTLRSSATALAISGLAAVSLANGGNPNLVVHYKLNETAGATAFVDSSGNGFDALTQAFPVLGQPGVSAGSGFSAEFDGFVTHGRATDGPPLTTLTSDLTVAGWVNPNTVGIRQRIFGNDGSWTMGLDTTGLIFTTRGILDYPISVAYPAGSWMHVAVVFDANFDATFYLDGNLVGTVVGSAPSAAPVPDWTIGALEHSVNGLIEVFDGRIDDIQVYDCALTPTDITALFQNPGQSLAGAPSTYCTAKVNSLGCTPSIGFTGSPSISGVSPFHVTANQVINNKVGILFYGLGSANIPFQGGLLCVQPPIKRTGVQPSGGNPPPNDCTGTYDLDFGALLQAGTDPSLVLGAQVFAQYWSRDPASPSTTGLSDGLEFTVGG